MVQFTITEVHGQQETNRFGGKAYPDLPSLFMEGSSSFIMFYLSIICSGVCETACVCLRRCVRLHRCVRLRRCVPVCVEASGQP